ncbi:Sensor histidine kinase DesK [Micromonospora sp. MW-13]|uniref:sensor histidine kinase n=1 Tax=unclassified Micromonospora TaxID=2617518 RepID=UPI000ED74356|nr:MULTISPECIES: sensor histidine kinase [unclassified Micromonospora]MCX4472463.1 sensor histidine kinase [Micromonospora sp. NBC_01655]RGC69577.1 Sensor histidine kinase DesK [Micromonospora sp. MW-13]
MSTAPTPGDSGWRRPGPTPEQQRHDLYIGLAVAVVALFNLTLTSSAGLFVLGDPPSWPERLLWSVAVTLPLAWRRRRPEVVAVAVAVAFIAGQVRSAPEAQLSSGALFAAIYTLGAWGPDRRRSRAIRIAVIAAMFAWLALAYAVGVSNLPPGAFADAAGPVPPVLAAIVNGVLLNVLIFGFAYFFGETAWTAARREHQLAAQAEQLRRSQAEAHERAILTERVRIARELHDSVAHHVSVMGVQAAAGRRVLDRDPAKARTALGAIEQSARSAVDELRRMLGLLRQPGGPQPDEPPATTGVDRIPTLLDTARAAGLRTHVGVYGDPVPLPGPVSHTAYRVVQEAVTNTVKHAGASMIDVRIRYLASQLEVDVSDDGRGTAPTNPDGMGLVGMRERIAAHDGELETGPRTGNGFRVRARLPLTRQAAGRAA